MENRRMFIKKCLAGYAALAVSSPALAVHAGGARPQKPITRKHPKSALVTWYSQTGHTSRMGRVICDSWKSSGLAVDSGDYREINKDSLSKYDLIAIGTPVHYLNVPLNLRDWIKALPHLEGTSIASFVTYGGRGDEQHNTACSLLQQMTDLGGAAAGLALFGNMSTFAPTWSVGNAARILAFKDRPNEATYRQARGFAQGVLANVAAGRTYSIEREFGLASLMAALPQIALTKLLITNHHIDRDLCIKCGTCVNKCPVGAVDLQAVSIDTGRCIACIGCVNNCPTQAMKMSFLGKPVYGYGEFLKRNGIEIKEPA